MIRQDRLHSVCGTSSQSIKPSTLFFTSVNYARNQSYDLFWEMMRVAVHVMLIGLLSTPVAALVIYVCIEVL
jgi:hypothetical protein